MYFDEVFPLKVFINLDSRKDRLEQAKSEFDKIGISPIRKSGIVPDIEDTFIRGTVGCLVSHYHILNAANLLGCNVFVFEDDVLFLDNNVIENMNLACSELEYFDWDILYFGANILLPFNQTSDHLAKLNHCQSTVSYGINKKFIPELINSISLEKINRPIDVIYSDMAKDHNFYITVPMLTIQRDSYSDIEGQDVNYSSYLEKRYFENIRLLS